MSDETFFDEYITVCSGNYEAIMDEYFEVAKTAKELETFHLSACDEVIQSMEATWESFCNNERELPLSASDDLRRELNKAFEFQKRVFLRNMKKEAKKTAEEAAFEKYVNEMEKYFSCNPNVGIDDTDMQHNNAKFAALTMISSDASITETESSKKKLLTRINARYEDIFKQRATMNEISIKDPAIGIDLGTTNCCVMIYIRGSVQVIPNRPQNNSNTVPSYVAFHGDNDTFGNVAKEEAYLYPEVTIYDAKRIIGRKWGDKSLMEDIKTWPFGVVNDDNNPKILTGNKKRYPHEVSARLLARFRVMAEKFLQLPPGRVRKAVITVPAYFSEPQRRATKQAAECAGLEVLSMINEPTAAALAYSWKRGEYDSKKRNSLIYDLGGGTFDVAVAQVSGQKVDILTVNGDTHLGGRDFDRKLMEFCLAKFKLEAGVDLEEGLKSESIIEKNKSNQSMSRLRNACEKLKEGLSTSIKQTIHIERLWGDYNFKADITKGKFQSLIEPVVRRTLDIVSAALEDAKEKGIPNRDSIDDVIMVGGSTRVPLVMDLVMEYFNGKQLCIDIHPDEAVAYGAAIQAAICNKIETRRSTYVHDVTAFSLGTDVEEDRFSILIPRNSRIPFENSRTYITSVDNQESMTVNIYQGEDEVCSNNEKIGDFVLYGLAPRPAGHEECTVTMRMDSSGILEVTAASSKSSQVFKVTADRLGMDSVNMERVRKECENQMDS